MRISSTGSTSRVVPAFFTQMMLFSRTTPSSNGFCLENRVTCPFSLVREGEGERVVPVQHHLLAAVLMDKEILFRRDILLHAPVDIQMIGRQIGDNRNIRTGVHGHQLEGGELQNRHVAGLDGLDIRQQRPSDVAAQVYPITSRFPSALR